MSLRNSGFVGSVVFAALAALALARVVRLVRGFGDATAVTAVYLTLVAATYAVLLGGSRSERLGGAVLVGAGGFTTMVLSDGLASIAVALTLAFALVRARIACRGRLSHPWLVEVGLGFGALVAANAVVRPNVSGLALAVWAFWLVQSAYFLVPGRRDGDGRVEEDPFDVAMRRATDLMDNR